MMNGGVRRRIATVLGATSLLAVTMIAIVPLRAAAPDGKDQAQEPFAVEYYYKIRWGHFPEFLELYRRNHYPILKKLQEHGRILEMRAVSPRHHAGEGARWDFRFTIVYRNVDVAHNPDVELRESIVRELYPDRETFEAEEQRRFELFEEHMDVPIQSYDLASW